jgi:hypothetical protein
VAWNNLTLAYSYKLENIQRKFARICFNRFIQSVSSCKYDAMLTYLSFEKLSLRRQRLDALFLINVFKNKIDCCSCMNTVGLRLPTKHIRYFLTFLANDVSRLSPILRCVKATNKICKFIDILINRVFPLRTHSLWFYTSYILTN